MSLTRRGALIGTGAVVIAAGSAAALRQHRLDQEPSSPPLVDSNQHLLWRNWSGIQSAYPAERLGPRSEAEVLDALHRAAAPVRPVGAGHSFTALIPTDGTLISLDGLAGIVSHDPASCQATVWGGTRLQDLGPALSAVGQRMPNLPDINKQSLAGALATATHGSGAKSPALHAQVTAFRLATPAAGILECSWDQNADVFHAARVGLGAFGVMTQITLQNSPAVRLRKRVELRPTPEAIGAWPHLRESHHAAELFVLPFTGMTAVVTHDETTLPVKSQAASRDTEVLLDLKRLRDWAGFWPGLRRHLAQWAMAGIQPEESVEESWKLLSNERDVRFNEMEYHLPREEQTVALREVLQVIESRRHDVFFPIEVRSVASDDAWLSPFHGRDCGSLALHAYYKDDYRFMFDLIEPILRRHGGRPHWGKLHSLSAAELTPLYPRWSQAMEVRARLDPDGRLLNSYLKRLLGYG
jgi:FAD-linked oxidoreductase